ncbi:MAG: tyrosine-type recombinase/integrase [Anaerolineaceae bacterium]|nr:tyrosine-type recombinase/integrase [Anaerolineaceae bacterium]
MTPDKRTPHFKALVPPDTFPNRVRDWLPANLSFYLDFRRWLRETGYSPSALNSYGVAARLALGWLERPYWQIDPQTDLQKAVEWIGEKFTSPATRAEYRKGVLKLGQFLILRCHRPALEKPIHWAHYLGDLPGGMGELVRGYLLHCQRRWSADRKHERTTDTLSQLTRLLRWMLAQPNVQAIAEITPALWYGYLDARLAVGISPDTTNGELRQLQAWLRFAEDQGQPVCQRTLRVEPLQKGRRLPRDVPAELLRQIQGEIQKDAASGHAGTRRMGVTDQVWFLLMLHSGLRTGEVRRLKLADLDWERKQVRIEQSKGLKDRIVYLSEATLTAIRAYFLLRGPVDALPDHVLIYRHQALSESYCGVRLRVYGERCGIAVSPHQLRHSCATLLLNAGAPVLTVQTLLGHKHVDTTLGYTRLYDGTIAADYYRAMREVEQRLALPEDPGRSAPSPGELLALVDALRADTVHSLRAGILAWADERTTIQMGDVKVPAYPE